MIDRSDVALVMPTRGDVLLADLVMQYPGFARSYIWDNSARKDIAVYGRYAAIEKVDAPVIISQDDDVILDRSTIETLLSAYEPGKIVCNVPERFRLRYSDSGMIGFGAIFDRDLPAQAFQRWQDNRAVWVDEDRYGPRRQVISVEDSARFLRQCDIVFTMLTPVVKLDLPYAELPYARHESRMWRQPGHFEECDAMRELCREVRDS